MAVVVELSTHVETFRSTAEPASAGGAAGLHIRDRGVLHTRNKKGTALGMLRVGKMPDTSL